MLLFALPMAWVSIKLLTDCVVYRKRPGLVNKAKKSTLCFLSGSIGNDSTRQADKKKCSYSFPWENSHTIVNHKIYQTLQPDFNFGFGSRSSKSSPRRVREPQSRVLLWKSSTIEARSVTPR